VVHDEHDVAAGGTVTAVGPAQRGVRLATERDAPCAPVASLDVEAALVDELGHRWRVTVDRTDLRRRYAVRCTGLPSMRDFHVVTSYGCDEKAYWIPHQHEPAVVSGFNPTVQV
jgi:hypothetical protein